MEQKICVISLGCSKNLVESEHIIYAAQKLGYTLTGDINNADIAIINTCGFISDATSESIQYIINTGRLKENGKLKYLLVTGCMVERYRDELLHEMPEIDAIVSSSNPEDIIRAIESIGDSKRLCCIKDNINIEEYPRILSTPSYMAYIKISEGCNNNCSFCTIPAIKGKYRSRTIENIVKEVRHLSRRGVKEIILVAQDTSRYGIDIYHRYAITDLLEALGEIDGIKWIRLMYCYPEAITDKLIETIKDQPKVCHYLDMPIQHCSNRILKSMHRDSSKNNLISIINRLRENIPDIVLRTTLMVGYPGESDREFNELLDFINEMEFDNVGTFAYSREEGTEAFDLPDQIKQQIKIQRKQKVMITQRDISYSRNQNRINNVYEVLIEKKISNGKYMGRYFGQAPEVDGIFYVNSKVNLTPGQFVKAITRRAYVYDLEGEYYEEDGTS
ncbi:30S ribosomal protein S12 methylthiotransferase RimO [Calorimonas adulescens]|uniref:Ribosomal protein uS12 methylthiotransferase RimO n=1 Tax=Calorimonas adulescens TaxID=2606906 RepID=A0A5D8QD39_9THEO|nr:30S ribosomal protein S12 methylthiotransferase RimO [Calorimonas adulescens]TZE82039.1 30S ribosomal protein S12 methylthiotransferase RimO [Calorimonas adulescens]